MRSSKNVVISFMGATVALLLLVHTQVSIFRVSYQIQEKKKTLAVLSDEYRVKQSEVSKLHSLSYLDQKRSEMKLDLVVPKEVKVISVPADRTIPREVPLSPVIQKGLFSFVQLVKEAQAKTTR